MKTITVAVYANDPTMLALTLADFNGLAQTMLLTPAEAKQLASELPAVADAARANERRCGTCGHLTIDGACDWADGASVPPWLYLARPRVAPTDHPNCPAWTKREGGTPNG